MGLFNRLERILGRFAIPNLSLYLIGGQVMFFGFSLLGHFDLWRIVLVPADVLAGEYWRLFSFVLVPPVSGQLSLTGALFLGISWYFFYMISQAPGKLLGRLPLQPVFLRRLGADRGRRLSHAGNADQLRFFAVSVFLAFALLNPDFELYLFFILPVKIKWFALVMWLGYAFVFVTGTWNIRLAVLASVGNFLLFFTGEIVQRIKTGRRHMQQQVRRTAMREADDAPRHRCVVCGKTDQTDPKMEFRYCSQCVGEECYCSEHIRNHVHTTVVAKE
ncbi:MAG: hypothetical protein WDM96_01115 [Lacunisphaera sp.]